MYNIVYNIIYIVTYNYVYVYLLYIYKDITMKSNLAVAEQWMSISS